VFSFSAADTYLHRASEIPNVITKAFGSCVYSIGVLQSTLFEVERKLAASLAEPGTVESGRISVTLPCYGIADLFVNNV
jgi:hypothetical protein